MGSGTRVLSYSYYHQGSEDHSVGAGRGNRAVFTHGQPSALVVGMTENRITVARGSLGVRLTEADEVACSCCRRDAWIQVNIDGIYSYLCAPCWQRLLQYVESPLR